MPDNITGIVTSKAVFYAMDPATLERYASFKDYIGEMSIGLSTSEINRIRAEIKTAREETRKSFFVDESGSAHIYVTGPLENAPDPCAVMFDIEMTTYSDIINETRAAEADDNIKKIKYHFDTPGGNIVGLFKTADVIRKTTKPTEAIIEGLCASAGYALASQCDTIPSDNIATEIGSIGVVTEITDRSGQDAGEGVKRYILTSANAENKIPDVTTEAGRDNIIKRLTDLESVFVEYVAHGRNTTTEDVLLNFGRGGILIARDARAVGMIDSITSELNTGLIKSPKPVKITGKPPVSITGKTPAKAKTTPTGDQNKQGAKTMGEITMSDDQLAKFGQDIADKTATKVKTEMTADFDARELKATAELKRKDGFKTLLAKFPEQANLISGEMEKESAEATADFTIKVVDAETARLAAVAEQQKNATDKPGTVNPDGTAGKPTDESGSMLAASLGLKIGGVK